VFNEILRFAQDDSQNEVVSSFAGADISIIIAKARDVSCKESESDRERETSYFCADSG
jgi:hypothetical protein